MGNLQAHKRAAPGQCIIGAFMPVTVTIAKVLLKLLPAVPRAEYLPLDRITLNVAMERARQENEDERAGGLLKFFGEEPRIKAEMTLDLGCGFGGRTVEFQRRTDGYVIGLEIDYRVSMFASRFALAADSERPLFLAGVGERLPLVSDSIDLILSYDVLEHVEEPSFCLTECWRVLKPGGLLLAVFPPYFHPTGAHLEGYVSRLPYANLLFPKRVLIRAIDEILSERNDGFRPQALRPNDKLYCLNGLTLRRFNRLIRQSGFEVVSLGLAPLFSGLNRNYEAWRMRYYAWLFRPLSRIPILQECFTHRVIALLRKPNG